MSGHNAWDIASKIFKPSITNNLQINFKHSRFYHGWIINPDSKSLIDEVILLAFQAPKSYTAEDVIEIQCHGGINITQKILQLCLDHGARLAENGEFTKRAFINGRIDLTQVEAILDIISAKTELFSNAAAYNLSGKLSASIKNIRLLLLDLLAHIHASIDFPDEVDEMPNNELGCRIHHILNELNHLKSKASDGNILKYGIKVAIIGKPNVGKSSLFNYLLNSNRSIVTNIPGTTRDILEEYIDIDGIPVILIDTAGIRDINPENEHHYIESIGIDRSKSAIQNSDIILFIYDINDGIQEEDTTILDEISIYNKPILNVANKLDLGNHHNTDTSNTIKISAKEGIGIDILKQMVKSIVLGDSFKASKDEVYINLRHKECLKKAIMHLDLSLEALERDDPQDLISIDIKSSLLSLDEIVGEVVSEDIIDRIFSQFCVGK